MPKTMIKRIFVALVILVGSVVFFHAKQSYSANLTSVSVTLSTSRPSFRGILGSGNVAGTSNVTINTTGGIAPSISTAQLVEGDALLIGNDISLGPYTVTQVTSASEFNITPVLSSGDENAGDDVIATASASLTANFTTATAVSGGTFRLLVPAEADDTDSADGIPDAGKYDFTFAGPTVTCPNDVSGYTFVTGTATASAITVDGADYHSFDCAYTGLGAIGTTFNTTNNELVIASLINPAPASGHVTGTADRNTLIVQHLDSDAAVVDQTSISVGVIEAVRVTAVVAPIITFQIAGVASSTSACGETTSVTTTAAAVPFGELLISSFRTAAQTLTVSTNASGGYVVTARANDQMGRNGGTCTGDPTSDTNCIPDSVGDAAAMTHTNEDEWSSTAVKGFAYTLDDYDSTSAVPAFEYDSGTNDCDATGECYRQFADTEGSQAAVSIFSASAPSDNHYIHACYKNIISAQQSAGNYENYITYIATATF